MIKQKQNKLQKTDYVLFTVGFISITLVAIFLANSFFRGHVVLLLLEAILYVAIVVLYIQAFRASRVRSAIQFTRIVSYIGIVAAILIASFMTYFIATFHW